MQKDFHHAVTYTVARLATFGHREAETIAYCAQYVDDATNNGTVKFGNNAMQRFRVGDPEASVPGLAPGDHEKISHLLRSITDEDGDARHGEWLKKIGEGYFSFPPAKLEYRAKGVGSWKHQALGTRKKKDKKSEVFPYDPSFLGSDWKLFHDALQTHRLTVIRDILPLYGICAA